MDAQFKGGVISLLHFQMATLTTVLDAKNYCSHICLAKNKKILLHKSFVVATYMKSQQLPQDPFLYLFSKKRKTYIIFFLLINTLISKIYSKSNLEYCRCFPWWYQVEENYPRLMMQAKLYFFISQHILLQAATKNQHWGRQLRWGLFHINRRMLTKPQSEFGRVNDLHETCEASSHSITLKGYTCYRKCDENT